MFSQITLGWRGRPLTSYNVVINTISAVTTRTGLTVTAVLDRNPCPTGTQISDEQIKEIEDRHLTRHQFHGEWNYTVLPVPRPAPEPEPEPQPARPGRCSAGLLNHPALTGMDPADLTALAAALEIPFRARSEQRRYLRHGRARHRAAGRRRGQPQARPHRPRCSPPGCRQHLEPAPTRSPAPCSAPTAPPSATPSSLTAGLLGPPTPHPPAAPPSGIRLRTLGDLREYAAGHGITIPDPHRPATHPPPLAHYKPPTHRQLN